MKIAKWILLIGAALLLGGLAGWLVMRPLWLTHIYGTELRPAVQRYLEVLDTIEGRRDPDVMAQVATGKYLQDLIRSRCIDCRSVEVNKGIQIQSFEVLDYTTNTSKVRAQYEGAWQSVDTLTGAVVGQCNVGVYSIDLTMTRENNFWKVEYVEEY